MGYSIKLRDGTTARIEVGQVIICDIFGEALRVQANVSSWIAAAYQLTPTGKLKKVA